MRPILHTLYMPMLHRVVMNVIKMGGKIAFITNHVFPKSPLPDTTFTRALTAWRQAFANRNPTDEGSFDQAPARGKIGIIWRQSPHAMQVIGQHDNRINPERSFLVNLAKGLAQQVNVIG
jgi:hypothetical protein